MPRKPLDRAPHQNRRRTGAGSFVMYAEGLRGLVRDLPAARSRPGAQHEGGAGRQILCSRGRTVRRIGRAEAAGGRG